MTAAAMHSTNRCINSVRRMVCVMLAAGTLGGLTGCAAAGSSGSTWTILCAEMKGQNQDEIAERIAASLKATPGVRADDVYLMEGSDGATRLYYGTYRRPLDSKTGKRPIPPDMRRDLDLLKELGTDDGRRPFLQSIPVRTPQPDVGNPEWDLRRVTAVYTLQVAAFEPTDKFAAFKKAAADYCALLREDGYEAYYHHTDSSSIVTVGLFGEDAFEIRSDGRSYYSIEVRKLQRDEKLKYNLLNGHIYKVKNDEGDFISMPSSLVLVPKELDESPW